MASAPLEAECSMESLVDGKPQHNVEGLVFLQANARHAFAPTSTATSADITSIPSYPDITVMDSSNGLLLYGTQCYSELYNVYSFATRKRLALPAPSVVAPLVAAGLAYDPSVSPHFKVVLISEPAWVEGMPARRRREVEVYSSETRRWSKPRLPEQVIRLLSPLKFSQHTKPAFCGGSLYFQTRLHCDSYDLLVRFDFRTESIDFLPHRFCHCYDSWQFGECRGSLYCTVYQEDKYPGVEMWRFEEATGEWVLVWLTGLELPERGTHVEIAALHPDFEEVVFIRCLAKDNIYVVNLGNMTWQLLSRGLSRIAGNVYPVMLSAQAKAAVKRTAFNHIAQPAQLTGG